MQFSFGPLYDRPPDPPVFEPPTNHPFDKAEREASPAEDGIPGPENDDLADGTCLFLLLHGKTWLISLSRWSLWGGQPWR